MTTCKTTPVLGAYDLSSDLRCMSNDKETVVYSIDVLHMTGTSELACTWDTVSVPTGLIILLRAWRPARCSCAWTRLRPPWARTPVMTQRAEMRPDRRFCDDCMLHDF